MTHTLELLDVVFKMTAINIFEELDDKMKNIFLNNLVKIIKLKNTK